MANLEKETRNKNNFYNSSFNKNKPSNNKQSNLTATQGIRLAKKRKSIHVGDVCDLIITAIGPKGIGIDELSYGYSVFVPNATLGEKIKAKIMKIGTTKNRLKRNTKYAIAKVLEKTTNVEVITKPPVNPGDLLDVKILKCSSKGAGLVEISDQYKLIVVPSKTEPLLPSSTKLVDKLGDSVKIVVTRVKSKYGFAKLVSNLSNNKNNKTDDSTSSVESQFVFLRGAKKQTNNKLIQGSKLTITLPSTLPTLINKQSVGASASTKNSLKSSEKTKYIPVKLESSIIFVKLSLGAKPGDKVRIKLTKVSSGFALAKILQINPISSNKKRSIIRNSIQQMVNNGMHFGEKAVKCNARMKNYIWYSGTKQKQGQNTNRPYIKKGRHVINLLKTRRCLNKALNQLCKYAAKGRTFLFIGTKKPAAGLIARASLFSQTSFFVNTRWLGGMLTNWKTIYKSIYKIRPILKEKQKIVCDILEKRQNIKARLIQKALLLRKKSILILNKGRQLIQQWRLPSDQMNSHSSFFNNAGSAVPVGKDKIQNDSIFDWQNLPFATKAKKLSIKRKQLIEKSQILLEKRQNLLEKRREIMFQSQNLKNQYFQTAVGYKALLQQLVIATKRLRELKSFYICSKEIQQFKTLAMQQNKSIYSISYGKFKDSSENMQENNSLKLLPNPPKEVLNRIVMTMFNARTNSIQSPQKQTLSKGSNVTIGAKSASFSSHETEQNQKVVLLSKLLSKFSIFSPYIKSLIQVQRNKIKQLETLSKAQFTLLQNIQKILVNYATIKNDCLNSLQKIKNKLYSSRNIIRILKRKLQFFSSQKKLIKFLPRLRYLPTPITKIYETVQILMRKIVDPKFKYPIDNIYDKKLSANSKKLAAARKKKWQRLEKYFGGIANMTKLNKAKIYKNVAIIIGQREEMNAVRECKKLGIKMFNIVDTNCNPTLADHIIPANDDSRNSIKYILNKFLVRIRLAQKLRVRLERTKNKKFNKNSVSPKK